MQFTDFGDSFVIKLSKRDTSAWATKPGAAWPCSTLSGHCLTAGFNTGGLVDLSVDGRDAPDDIDGHELSAMVADHAAERIDADHPCHFVAVGQFKG